MTVAVLILMLLIILLNGTIISTNGVSENQALAQKPGYTPRIMDDVSTPIQAVLSIDDYPPVGQSATLTCEISSILDAPNTTAQIELPANARLLNGNLNWQGDLLANSPITFAATIVFDTVGDAAVFCRAHRIIDAENSWGDLAELYLSIGQADSEDGFLAPAPEERDRLGELEAAGDGQTIDQAAGQPAPSREGQILEPPPSVAPSLSGDISVASNDGDISTQGTLTITGRWRFYDRDDNLTSEQMLVEIVRGDNSNHLAWCYTGVDGYYSCGPFTNPGSAGVRSRFLSYTSFTPYGDVLVTINPDWGTTGNADNAFGATTSVQTFSDGTYDIGSWYVVNGDNYERAYWITHDLIRVYKYIWFGAGSTQSPQETTGSATVEWKIDSTGCPFGDGGACYIPGGNIHLEGEDPLSNTVVGHEYGHNIQWTVYGGNLPPNDCPEDHFVQFASGPNCAWTEGWADFLPLAVNNDPVYRWASGAQLNLENPTWGTPNWDEGDAVEGRVAGALWDILDTVNENDDQYSDGGIVNIWDTIYHQNDNNFSQYWSAWKSRGHNNTSAGPVMGIFQNTIDYRNGPANDDFANATIISSLPYMVTNLNTANATTQGNDPNTLCGSISTPKQSRSVWYRYTPTTTGNYSINTNGSNYDTVLSVWIGSFESLMNQGCDDDGGSGLQSSLTLTLNSGTTYYIEAMQYGSGSGGQLTLNVTGGGSSGPPLDVYLLVDLTGSFADDLPTFQAQAPTIISTLTASNPNTRFGLGKFEDYPINPFGSAAFGDKAYERLVDLTFDTNLVLDAISGLFTRWGMDGPESQLPALYQTATGAGQDLSGVGYPGASIPAGQQANFRADATKLIILWTDASFHRPGDPGDIPYPGPGFAETASAINALGDAFVLGIFSGGAGSTAAAVATNQQNQQPLKADDGISIASNSDLVSIVSSTGAFADDEGVDCNNDGTIDIHPGQPLVCAIGSTGEGIGEAIIALVEADIGPARVFLPIIVKNN